jgi:hypothetical protein
MSISLLDLTVDKYIKPFTFYDFDTDMYSISFFASDPNGKYDWYVDQLLFKSDIEAQFEIDQIYCSVEKELELEKVTSCIIL